MISKGIYEFKTEFWKLTGITRSQWERRKEELLDWLLNFYDYDFLEGRPERIYIKEIYSEYQPLPRKKYETNVEQKMKDYEEYTLSQLTDDFSPNSFSRVAGHAIAEWSGEKYNHTSIEAVARRYVRPAFEKCGENNDKRVWVWHKSYSPLTIDEYQHWQ